MNEQEILVIVITIKNKNEEKNYALSWSEIITDNGNNIFVETVPSFSLSLMFTTMTNNHLFHMLPGHNPQFC